MFTFINNASLKKLIAIIVVIGFLTYVSSFWNQFVWDDDHFFYQNIFTQDLFHIKEIFTSNTTAGAGVESNYYRPITTLSFALDHAIWGWNPIGLHLTNTVIHILNTVLLLVLLLRVGFGRIKSFLVSSIFLIHPIQTEAVTYLSSRGDIVYTLFLFLSVYLFTITLYKEKISIIVVRKTWLLSRNILLLFSLLLFPLSMLSKEGAITTVPMYLGVLLVFTMQKKLSFKKLHKQYGAHILICLLLILSTCVYFILRLTVLNFSDSLNYNGGYSLYTNNIFIRILTFLKVIVIDIRLLIVPYPLYLERDTSIATTVLSPWVISSLIIITGTGMLGIMEWRRKHTAWIFFALILIFAHLSAVSGIIPMTAIIKENWLYVPIIGFYMIIMTTGSLFFTPHIKKYKTLLSIMCILIFLIYIGMTIQQNYNWRDRIAYFEHNLRFTNTARIHLNLGNAYIGAGEYTKAMYHLQQAIKIADIYPQTHYNLGNIYIHQKKYDMAEKELLTSLAFDPNYLYPYSDLIAIYEYEGRYAKAVPYIQRLSRIYPNDVKITLMYAEALYFDGQRQKAEEEFKKTIALSHNNPKLIKAIEEAKK